MTNLQIKYIKKKKVKRIYLKKKIIKTIIIPRYLIILKKILKIFLKNQTTIKKNIKTLQPKNLKDPSFLNEIKLIRLRALTVQINSVY